MRIRQIKGTALLAEGPRRRLESIAFPNLERARLEVQHLFPNHLVVREPGQISVVVRDRSFQVATFQQVYESVAGLSRQ